MDDLDWRLIKKAMIDFLFALSLAITVPELWDEMCTVRLFLQGVDLFALKFYLDRVVSINHSWRQRTRDTELHDGEDRIPLRSLILTQHGQHRSVADGWTDRQTDLP